MFKKLLKLLKDIFIYDPKAEEEAYLAQAVDIYDLEWRMKNYQKMKSKNVFY